MPRTWLNPSRRSAPASGVLSSRRTYQTVQTVHVLGDPVDAPPLCVHSLDQILLWRDPLSSPSPTLLRCRCSGSGPRPTESHATAADRWTWLVLAAHTQLRLARPLAQDLRRPWERPMAPERLTPARVRRGFRNLCAGAAVVKPSTVMFSADARMASSRAPLAQCLTFHHS